jgi:hypothetical protein
MTREKILEIVRSTPRTHTQTPGDCYLMGQRLREFTPEEQAEILLWALEREQQQNADYAKTVDMLTKKDQR